MMETIGQKQRRFVMKFCALVVWASSKGYEFTWGESFRSDEQAEINAIGAGGRARVAALLMPHFPELARRIANNVGSGIRNTLHEVRLAVDVNLFVNGEWISDGASPHWKVIGEKWESMGEDHCWGGRFASRDSNHFSIEHEGRK